VGLPVNTYYFTIYLTDITEYLGTVCCLGKYSVSIVGTEYLRSIPEESYALGDYLWLTSAACILTRCIYCNGKRLCYENLVFNNNTKPIQLSQI
jgi:hypothetical protein